MSRKSSSGGPNPRWRLSWKPTGPREALRLDPTAAAAHNNLAIVLEDLGHRDEAVALPWLLGMDLLLRLAVLFGFVELFRRHWSSTGQALPTWDDVVAVEHAHLRILEAIAAGDDSLARYRTRRHLDAAASWWL